MRTQHTVHPHGCGEYRRWVPRGDKRFTPTAVGNTSRFPVRVPVRPVHPHGCGEYVAKTAARRSCCSVHPHGCGEYFRPLERRLHRFTPTAVGNTRRWRQAGVAGYGSPPRLWGIRWWRCCAWRATVHPHGCGEYSMVAVLVRGGLRFTPTAVGNTDSHGRARRADRFTPTAVGNTPPALGGVAFAGSPHGCGEYLSSSRCGRVCRGSPPRLWGIRGRLDCGTRCGRFTPTAVGNTARTRRLCPGCTVHPHGCGEYLCPLVNLESLERRFTPTAVGNTVPAREGKGAAKFTPTAVGNTAITWRNSARLGSPPRLWGIRCPWNCCPGNTVHPHGCGEYFAAVHWGRPHTVHPHGCGGYTRVEWTSAWLFSVHPHGCGEYTRLRLRGRVAPRFTPTAVGNRIVPNTSRHTGSPPRLWEYRSLSRSPPFLAVHPHGCGNTRFAVLWLPSLRCGSPPRLWGIHRRFAVQRLQQAVHPHGCGNHPLASHPSPP